MTEITPPSEIQKSGTDFLSRPLLVSLNIDWEKAIYIAFILIAIVSRFWGLGDRVMSHDESLHTQFSYQFYRGDGFNHTPLMHGPFLFHATALSYWLFGDSDFTARVPVAVFGLILIILPYFLRPWLGRIGAIFTSFIFLISPYLLYYSRYIRHDIYAIVAAMLILIAIWHYLGRREEKFLWLLAGALSFLFTTKEVSFIYVAIFGGFVVLRLLPQIGFSDWFQQTWRKLTVPALVLLFGLVLIGGSFAGYLVTTAAAEETAVTTSTSEQETTDEAAPPMSTTEKVMRWTAILGIGVAGVGLFMGVRALRPYLDDYPEFDLIILFATLILPFVSPVLITIAGWDPQDYNLGNCLIAGQENFSGLQLALRRLFTSSWWSCTLTSGLPRIYFFAGITIIISIMVGLWWNRRRWLIVAAIFYSIFLVLFTSVFTNPFGVTTGMIGSLGYWLVQQEVQRGSQPPFYYFFVVPFYEFLPVVFSLLGIWLWFAKQQLRRFAGYWLLVALLAWFSYSLVNWWFNAQAEAIVQETSTFPGLLVSIFILLLSITIWFLLHIRQEGAGIRMGVLGAISGVIFLIVGGFAFGASGLLMGGVVGVAIGVAIGSLPQPFNWDMIYEFMPFLIWWFLLTWVAYSYAGEKMPWLSTHFVIPMALISGWYFQQKLQPFTIKQLFSKDGLLFIGLTIVTVVAFALAFGPIILGTIQFGDQQLDNLSRVGRLLGTILAVAVLLWLWFKVRSRIGDGRLRSALWSLSLFAILTVLTIRVAYQASFTNADYVQEYLVYAHGAPAAKSIVLDQVDELSQRLYGDNSIKVAYGGSGVPWPFTWYMREYPNSVYFAESPTNTLTESPVVLVGRSSWDQVDNILGNDYDHKTYTYLWWPMEDYRQINWNAILGDPNVPEGSVKRGLQNPDVRQAIWDIWFYRDFEKYDQTFGKNHTSGQWPLRDELRLYIRNDVMAQLWDHGISPINVEPVVQPFTEGTLDVEPSLVLNAGGIPSAGAGELLAPRNIAVDAEGNIFVLDSGNARVQVFDPEGTLMTTWGAPGTGPGEFNAEGQGPWGIAVDDEFVYVADTWNHRVQKFSHDGEFVASFGQPGDISSAPDQGLGFFFGPRDIEILDDGRLLITDTGNHRVQIMDENGNFIGQIGGSNGLFGSNLGFFYEPVGMALGNNGEIYVVDTWNGRVQQFSLEFLPVSEWPVQTLADSFSINNKPYAATDSAGRIYVTDPENFRVLIFNPNGQYLGKFGQFGTEPNSFAMPTGIFIDSQDNIYVADADNNRILKYAPIFAPAFSPVEEPVDDLLREDEAVEEDEPEDVRPEDEAEEESQPEDEEEPVEDQEEAEPTDIAPTTVDGERASPTPEK